MPENRIKVSLIIPVYNVEKYLRDCLDSVINQTIPKSELEVLLINDGSTDSSYDICKEYAETYDYIKLFSKQNEGLSRTRNYGIMAASGKYIAYLDSDDRLSENVLKKTTDFFDKHYDEIDEVAYKIVPIESGVRKKTHYRYQILKQSGVYDLTQGDNIFITQTNIDVVVKNRGDENILFDATPGFKHEDQMYNAAVLSRKLKIGYVDGCEYLYERNPESIVSGYNSADLFDITFQKWEELFESYLKEIPKYIQALFFNDLQWKIKADILLPYYLEGNAYENEINRIVNLLKYVDDYVIINHPHCNQANKFYFLSIKYGDTISDATEESLILKHKDEILFSSEYVDLVIDRFFFRGEKIEVCGHISSPVFSYIDKPELIVTVNNQDESVKLYESSWCYEKAKVKNNQAWGFNVLADTSKDADISFSVLINDKKYKLNVTTGEWVAFNKDIGRMEYVIGTKHCRMNDNCISIKNVDKGAEKKYRISQLSFYIKSNLKVFLVRFLNVLLPQKRIWLYHDCKGVGKDNAYYQFVNDFNKNDGIKRYYVVNGSIDSARDMFTPEQQKCLIELRSTKHKLLYLNAEKIITAFISKVDYRPFFDDVYKYYIDLFRGEVIYLQHGVLHAHLPWKYSYDRLDIAYEVVSSDYEVKNLTENYCFPETALIKSKMPRYDIIDTETEAKENRILYAPSWRKYLVSQKGNGEWVATDKKFLASDYYKKTVEFLNSKELERVLEENDWYLDFKAHPIFARYNKHFNIENSRVTIKESIVQSDYKILVTDYSSFVFDFVYLKKAVVYFVPDYSQFKSGMNDYRELDIPLEKGFGKFTQNISEAIKAITEIIKNDGKSIPPFEERNNNFFFNYDKNCVETIYHFLKK